VLTVAVVAAVVDSWDSFRPTWSTSDMVVVFLLADQKPWSEDKETSLLGTSVITKSLVVS